MADVLSIADVSMTMPDLGVVLGVLTLQAGFNSAIVVIGATLLGIAAGTVGAFALLRDRSLMGDALAHSALPGLGLAFIVGTATGIGGRHLWLLLTGAAISGCLGIICVQLIARHSRLQDDAAIGAVLSCFFGAGVVVLSIIQSLGTGDEGGLHHFIFGQTAAMTRADTILTFVAMTIAIALCGLLFKEFRLVSFDRGFAAAQGWPISGIDLVMMGLVVLVTVVGLQAVGLLLIVAFLIIPAAGARFWTESLQRMVIISGVIGGLSGYLGSCASALLPRLPAGAVIVLVSGVIFCFSFLFAPARGIGARLLSHLQLKRRITIDHFLRDIYELMETRGIGIRYPGEYVSLKSIPFTKEWGFLAKVCLLLVMFKQRLIEVAWKNSEIVIRLSPSGVPESRQRVRNHRLWEEYLILQTDLPVSHVDYSADLVEHVLSAEIVADLEASLTERLDKDKSAVVPENPHG